MGGRSSLHPNVKKKKRATEPFQEHEWLTCVIDQTGGGHRLK